MRIDGSDKKTRSLARSETSCNTADSEQARSMTVG